MRMRSSQGLLSYRELRDDRIVVADVALGLRNRPVDVHVVLVLLAAEDQVLADSNRLEDQSLAGAVSFDQRRGDEDVVELLVNEVSLFGFSLVKLVKIGEVVVGRG